MNRLFEESFWRPFGEWTGEGESALSVPIDAFESDGKLIVRASLPGVDPEDVDISVSGNTLTIKGEYEDEEEKEQGDFRLRERRYGAFHRAVALPQNVDADKIEASAKDGVLRIAIPRTEESKPKRISVKAG
jgi:HSP20 family protein